MTARRAPIAILAALAVAVAACGGGSGDGDEGATNNDRQQPNAWEQVLDGVTDDGTVPRETALQAFSLALGPLPGVDVPGGEVGTIKSATGAVRWLSRYYDELTPEQQQAAARLAPEIAGDQPGGVGGPGAHLAGPPPGQDSPGAEEYRAEVDTLIAEIGAQIGAGSLPYKIQIILETQPHDEGAHARAGGRDPCSLYLYPTGQALTGADRHNLLAHEVFHCYTEFVLNGPELIAPWLDEGMAEFVGASLAPTSALASEYWPSYLTTPGKVLFSRAYDAIGFYSHLEYAGADAWSLLVPMLLAADNGGNAGAFAVAVGLVGPLLDDWPGMRVTAVSGSPGTPTDRASPATCTPWSRTRSRTARPAGGRATRRRRLTSRASTCRPTS